MMKQSIFLLALVVTLTGCTTLNPVEMPPEDVQQMIVSGDILQPGTQAKIVTQDGRIRTINVERIDRELGIIETDEEPLEIAEIVAVETRDFSVGKTALLAVGSYSFLALLAMAIAPVFIL